MQFSQKLSALMRVLGISNKLLAEAIYVDPSLISRWRSGERAPGKNSDILLSLASFFSAAAEKQNQNNSLLAIMNLPLDAFYEQNTTLFDHLCNWLNEDNLVNQEDSHIAESFLLDTGETGIKTNSKHSLTSKTLPQGIIQSSEVFYGINGMREASLKLLSLSLASAKPQIISMFSDQSLSWLDDDDQFNEAWCDLLMKCLAKGDNVQIIHDVRRDSTELLSSIRRWLPFYMTGQVNSYYCPDHLHTIYRQTINAIEGVAAVISYCCPGMEHQAEAHLYTDGKTAAITQRMLNNILQNSLPLISVYTAKNYQELANLHMEFSKKSSNNISFMNMLTSFSSPEGLIYRIIERLDLPEADKQATLRQFREKQAILQKSLQTTKYTEIISLPEPYLLNYQNLRFNTSMFVGHNNAYYQSLDEFKEHISNIIHLLKSYENYQCFLQKSSPFNHVQIQARENIGVLFTKESETLFSFYLSQPSITRVFYNYMESIAAGFSKRRHSRSHTISSLEKYLFI